MVILLSVVARICRDDAVDFLCICYRAVKYVLNQ